MKHVMTDAINEIVKDENQKLQVFQKGGPYLSTKKIGKNNPREAEIKTDNYLRQEWNRNVDRALIAGVTEEDVLMAKKHRLMNLWRSHSGNMDRIRTYLLGFFRKQSDT